MEIKTINEMISTIEPSHNIEIEIQYYSKDEVYTAWIKGNDYRGCVVSANTLPEVLKELSISITVLEMYRKNIK